MEKFSIRKAAMRLGLSRTGLLKEIEEGSIVAHRRRSRIVVFEKDLEAYEKQNIINVHSKRIEECNNITWGTPVAQSC